MKWQTASPAREFTRNRHWKGRAVVLGLLALPALLAACGGSASDGATGGSTISGTATKGPVAGASVTAFAIADGAKGQQVGNASTDVQGHFTVGVGTYSGPVLLDMTGGTYFDEAANAAMPMQSDDHLMAMIPSVSGSPVTGIQITPLTSMAQSMAQGMAGGMSAANMSTANVAVGTYFMVGDILHTAPMNPMVSGSGAGATQDMKNYGMALAAMSQYAHGIGMTTSSSGMVTLMMQDASDGVMNGMMGSTAISMAGMGGMMGGNMAANAGTAGLATAMSQFIQSGMNKSGVTLSDMQAMMDKLNGSDGHLASAPGSMAGTMSGTAMMGTVASGTVSALAIGTDGAPGSVIATGTVDAQGHFSLPMGTYSGPMLLRLTGGTYADEATGSMMSMASEMVLTAAVPTVAAGSTVSGISITPLTSMAQAWAQRMSGGMTEANIATANAAVGSYFLVHDILHTAAVNPAVSAAGSTEDSKNYGMSIAAMSQYAHSLGMTTSSAMVTLMMDDASDGVMNGMMGSTPISMAGMGGMMGGASMHPTAGTSDLATAMTAFLNDMSMNKSGVTVTDMQPLITKLAVSNGALQ